MNHEVLLLRAKDHGMGLYPVTFECNLRPQPAFQGQFILFNNPVSNLKYDVKQQNIMNNQL
jgi:hypothetical protein